MKKTDIIPKTIAKTIIALLGLSFNIGSNGGSIKLNANSLLILAKRIVFSYLTANFDNEFFTSFDIDVFDNLSLR